MDSDFYTIFDQSSKISLFQMSQLEDHCTTVYLRDQDTQTEEVIVLQPIPGRTVVETAQQLLALVESQTDGNRTFAYISESVPPSYFPLVSEGIVHDVITSAPERSPNGNNSKEDEFTSRKGPELCDNNHANEFLLDCLNCWFQLLDCKLC